MPRRLAFFLLVIFLSACGSRAAGAEPLPGTKPLDMQGDLASQMVAGIDKFLLHETEKSIERRAHLWKRDLSAAANYEKSVEQNRQHLRRMIGAVDLLVKDSSFQLADHSLSNAWVPSRENQDYSVMAVRWAVLPGVSGEGVMLKPLRRRVTIAPDGKIDAPPNCIVIPDADQTPEMLAGLASGLPPDQQIARRLAENGCRVLVPVVIDRRATYSAIAGRPPTNQPHREFIYRPAFEMGRHVIGLEVQKILAAVGCFKDLNVREKTPRKLGIVGYGEGGLLALHAAALEPRIAVTCVSGYFDSRQNLWQEPIYRNVFGYLTEFGDAELASLIAPRALIIEASQVPLVTGPPAAGKGRSGGAAPGRLVTPSLPVVQKEIERAKSLTAGLSPAPCLELVASNDGNGPPWASAAVKLFLDELYPHHSAGPSLQGIALSDMMHEFYAKPEVRFKRQFDQFVEYTQHLIREGEYTRRAFWAKADRSSVANWQKTIEPYRDYFDREVIGRFDEELLPPNVRTRKIYDEPKYTGYEVVMDVFPDVFAYGILLLPKDIKAGERRRVVVCQHGLEGRPTDVADPNKENPAYHKFACKLAERGFITFAPQNPYIFTDRFRSLQRKLNPLKKTLFSIIVPQHLQATEWLASLPMVDPERIAFYGLSYGGKSAMRIPPLVKRYCLSICSADFNEWIWKNASTRSSYSYVGTGEYEIFEFDLGNTFNYAEMAGLIAPRPFMVERGHHDGVAPDEWVAYEYAKVRKLYSDLKIPDRTTIEFFDGPHTIHGVGTFAFLHKHLNWPEPGK
ncbi:MAG TPA: dienelactone hydrolase family protein [Gemmataceae bacterium]|jgi:dienelactone hydrolase|nr:dienelactone hydrolase family protein [Gemmataceae bacterium]